jgi:hypothetical protein
VTPDDLLLQLLVNPDDEALRAVWVDLLLERGDLRGEHANLRRLGRDAEAAELQRRHARDWVPPALERFVVRGSEQFRDGLLDGCSFLPISDDDARELALEPFWAAVRSLDRAPLAIIGQATALERLTGVGLETLRALWGRAGLLPKVRHLGLRVNHGTAALQTLQAIDVPSVTSLSLHVVTEGMNPRQRAGFEGCCEDCDRGGPFEAAPSLRPHALQTTLESPLGQRLRALELHCGYVDLTSFLEELESIRCDLETVHLRGVDVLDGALPSWTLTLTRTAPGRYGALHAEQVITDDDRLDVGAIVATAPAHLHLTPSRLRRRR